MRKVVLKDPRTCWDRRITILIEPFLSLSASRACGEEGLVMRCAAWAVGSTAVGTVLLARMGVLHPWGSLCSLLSSPALPHSGHVSASPFLGATWQEVPFAPSPSWAGRCQSNSARAERGNVVCTVCTCKFYSFSSPSLPSKSQGSKGGANTVRFFLWQGPCV